MFQFLLHFFMSCFYVPQVWHKILHKIVYFNCLRPPPKERAFYGHT